MRGTTTLENVVSRVHQMSVDYHDETVPLSDIEFHSLEHARVAGQEVMVLPTAQRLLANRIRVPHSYLSRCPSHLQAENLSYWLKEEQKTRQTFFCRFDGMKLRAVFTERYTELDNMEILSRMLDLGFAPTAETQYILDGSIMVLKMPDRQRAFGLSPEDRIVPGISISNSEVGYLAFSIEFFLLRLLCSNGLIAKTAVASRFKHISRKAMDQFPDILAQVASEAQANENRLRFSVNTPVDNPIATIATFNRQFQISQDEGEHVARAWETEPVFSMFGVINAYTHAAQFPSLSAEQSYRLEKAGGLILSMIKAN